MYLEGEMNANRIRLYRSLLGTPYVLANVEEYQDKPALPRINCGLFDQDFRTWLALLIWERTGFLLKEREVKRIIDVLGGWSMRDKTANVSDPELLRLLETDPLVATLVEFMRDKTRLETGMERLWRDLSDFARKRKLTVLGNNRFPGGANVLSRRLRVRQEALRRLGIKFEDRRSNGSKVVVERLDDVGPEPSAQSSSNNANVTNDLDPKDAKAELLARLKVRQQRGKGNHGANDQKAGSP